jgi:hypothetical protein
MEGVNIAEQFHVVNVIPPIDITGGKTGARFKMNNYKHATIIFQIGVSAAAFTKIFVKECNAASGGTANAIAYRLYAEETAAGDTLGAAEAVAATGRTPTANDNTMYVIEVDARELTDGYNWIEVSATNGSNSVIASCVAILSGSRQGGDLSATALV